MKLEPEFILNTVINCSCGEVVSMFMAARHKIYGGKHIDQVHCKKCNARHSVKIKLKIVENNTFIGDIPSGYDEDMDYPGQKWNWYAEKER